MPHTTQWASEWLGTTHFSRASPKISPKYLLNTVCTLTSPPSPMLELQQPVYATINPDSIFVPGAILTPWKVLQHFLLITCLLSYCSSALRDWTGMKHWKKLLCSNNKAKEQGLPTKHSFFFAIVHKNWLPLSTQVLFPTCEHFLKHISWKKAMHKRMGLDRLLSWSV